MGRIRIIVLLALILGLFGLFAGCIADYGDNQVFSNIEEFRRHHLRLPELGEAVSLVAVGDIMLSRYVALVSQREDNPLHSFVQVQWFWQDGDLVFGNLENPLTPGPAADIHGRQLRAEPSMAAALQATGFDLLSLANNHLPDFGVRGILDTMDYLEQAGLAYVGAGKNREAAYQPLYRDLNGVKLAFLAFTDPSIGPGPYRGDADGPHLALWDRERLAAAVAEAAARADFTVVYLHGGTEYQDEPDATQQFFARRAVDHGADLVIGSHPHVVQPVEQYRGKYIFYSLGNFIFDQFWSRATRESVMVKFHIRDQQLEQVTVLPVYIDDQTRPVPLTGTAGQAVAARLQLDLVQETVPAWDEELGKFTTAEQYTWAANREPAARRLRHRAKVDLDGDGLPEEIVLRDGILTVDNGFRQIWQSPGSWWVDYFFTGDVTNDGREKLCLSVWKEGSFGPFKPFWLEEEDTSVKNHLFVFRLQDGELRAVWQSSNLDHPSDGARLVDYDGDGIWELLVWEGSYTDAGYRQATLWQWQDWGFSLLAPVEPLDG